MDAVAVTLEPGTRIGEFIVAEPLRAHGGVSIHRAVQPSVKRIVALYVARAGAADAEALLARARALATVDHPGVLPVYDVGIDGDRVFAATPFPDARPAPAVIAEGPLAVSVAVSVIEQLADSIEALKRAGVPVAPGPEDVLLAGDRREPTALLAPLDCPDAGATPASGVAEIFAALAGPAGGDATTAARNAAVSGSPSAVAAAARAALPPPRRRRGFRRRSALVVVGVLAIAGVAIALVARHDSGPAASTSPGRITARIPIGGEPIDVAVVGPALWVTTTDGRLVRVDIASNRVVGSPRRLAREPLALLAAEGALYAFDGDRNTVMRLDARTGRVLRRRHIAGGTPLTGARVKGTLWIARQPFDKDRTGQPDVLALDARTLTPQRRSVPVGNLPAQIRVDGSTLFVVGEQDGTLTRIDADTGATRRILVSPKPGRPAVHQGRVWVPDGATGVVTAIDDRLSRPPAAVIPVGDSPAVVEARGALWVLVADQNSGAGAAASLVRLDSHGRRAGRALELGRGAENVVAAGGDLWVSSIRRRTLIRVTPSDHVARAAPIRETDPTRLLSGPSRPGRRHASVTGVGVSVDPGGTGWSVTAEPELIDLRRYDDPGIGVSIMVPAQVYGPRGSAQRASDAATILRTVRRVRNLRVSDERPTTIGGLSARSILLSARRTASRAAFCGGPCVPLFGRDRVTQLVQAPARARLNVLVVDGHAVAILEDTPDGRSLNRTGALVHALRFGAH